MNPRFDSGLVVGKFCPLHRGHLHLIGHARARCRELLLLSYTVPEFPGCGPDRRERWLRAHCGDDPAVSVLVLDQARLDALCAARGIAPRPVPHNDADDEAHRGFVAWTCYELLRRRVDAVFTSEEYGDGFAASMTRRARARFGSGGEVRHVCVDRARAAVPVSGTALRAEPHRHWQHLSEAAADDLLETVLLLGGESSGKTELARALAGALRTAWVPEYGRQCWIERGGALVFDDMLRIARSQVTREREARRQARRWLVCDTSPLTTLFYSRRMFGRAEAELETLAGRAYSHVLLCAPDIPFVQDGTRQDAAFRAEQHAWYLEELRRRGVRHRLVGGGPQARLREALDWIGAGAVA